MEALIQSEKLALFALENTAPTSSEEEEIIEEHVASNFLFSREDLLILCRN